MAKNGDVFERNMRRFEVFFASVARSVWRRGERDIWHGFRPPSATGRKATAFPSSSSAAPTPPLNAAALSPFPMRRCPLSCRFPNSSPALAYFWASPLPFPLRGRGLWGRGLFFIFWGFVFPSLCSYCSICLRLSPQGLCICTHCRILPHGGRFQSPA